MFELATRASSEAGMRPYSHQAAPPMDDLNRLAIGSGLKLSAMPGGPFEGRVWIGHLNIVRRLGIPRTQLRTNIYMLSTATKFYLVFITRIVLFSYPYS